MAEVDVKESISFSVGPYCDVLPNQALGDAEIAFLKAKSAVINLGQHIVRPVLKLR